jgi:hypothetical protein
MIFGMVPDIGCNVVEIAGGPKPSASETCRISTCEHQKRLLLTNTEKKLFFYELIRMYTRRTVAYRYCRLG